MYNPIILNLEEFCMDTLGFTRDQLAAIRTAHATPGGRFYHNWFHAMDVLQWVLKCHIESPLEEPREMMMAALFHDVIYVPGLDNNELESCKAMYDFLKPHETRVPKINITAVWHAIEKTAEHFKLDDGAVIRDPAKFMDCDIAGLADDWETFVVKNDQLHKEFCTVGNPEDVNKGRIKFLKSVLERPHIYYSEWGRERFEQQARRNIRLYLAKISGSVPV